MNDNTPSDSGWPDGHVPTPSFSRKLMWLLLAASATPLALWCLAVAVGLTT